VVVHKVLGGILNVHPVIFEALAFSASCWVLLDERWRGIYVDSCCLKEWLVQKWLILNSPEIYVVQN